MTTLDVVFSKCKVFSFVHNTPEAEAQRSYAHAALNYKTDREQIYNSNYLLTATNNIIFFNILGIVFTKIKMLVVSQLSLKFNFNVLLKSSNFLPGHLASPQNSTFTLIDPARFTFTLVDPARFIIYSCRPSTFLIYSSRPSTF